MPGFRAHSPVGTHRLSVLELNVPALFEKARRGLWTLAQLNYQYVDWVLTHVGGDKAEAARILGINISTLYRWVREHRVR